MNKDLQDLIDIRDYRPGDHAFIMATFLRGLYYGDSWFSIIPKDLFMASYKRFAEAILASPNNVVKLAVLREDNDVILGYSILSKDFSKLHWVFVKAGDRDLSWRNKGIARFLVPETVRVVTHLTETGKNLMSKLPNCVFNPFDL